MLSRNPSGKLTVQLIHEQCALSSRTTKQHYDIGLNKLLQIFRLAHIWLYGLTLRNWESVTWI